jgi:hypothetical protein
MTPTSAAVSGSVLALEFSSPDGVFLPDTSIQVSGPAGPGAGSALAGTPLTGRTVVFSANRIVSLVGPIAAPGHYTVTVTDTLPGGASVEIPLELTPATNLALSSFHPGAVQAGSWVTLFGAGFDPPMTSGVAPTPLPPPFPPTDTAVEGTTVRIGGLSAPVLALTDTVLLFRVPPGAKTGPVTVTTPNSRTTSPHDLTVLPTSAPLIAVATPSSGPTAGGDPVTITGSGFREGATVTFGGSAARDVRVLSDTSLTLLSPFASTSGAVPVTVTNIDGGTATLAGAYTFTSGTGSATRFIPVVLDVVSNAGPTTAHFTTETTLTNGGTSAAGLNFTYTASLGAGSGTVTDVLAPGQLVLPDTLAYLRDRGLPIPASGSQVGTLALRFENVSSAEGVAVTARTTASTAFPQPAGAAGLAYPGLRPSDGLTTSASICGLLQTGADRSNVAVFNTGPGPVTLKVTAFAGDGSGASSVVDAAITLAPGGWHQYSGILGGPGYASGWATVARTSPSGEFGAYGVMNDQTTNDGSYLPPADGPVNPFLPPAITLPVVVESASFLSEMVVSNRSPGAVTLLLRYTESLTPGDGSVQGTVPLLLQPGEQLFTPDAVDFFRKLGVPIGSRDQGNYAGTVRALVLDGPLDQVFMGARTAAPSPAGGLYGLFTPGIYAGREASTSAGIYGLRSDANNRSNVAVLNAGQDPDGPVTLALQVYDADAGGSAAGEPETRTLSPGQWFQYGNLLAGKGVSNGWVVVRRTAGSAPWAAYGVLNDGGSPGQRTGDGAYIPMSP